MNHLHSQLPYLSKALCFIHAYRLYPGLRVHSKRSVARMLNEMGVPAPRGGKWYAGHIYRYEKKLIAAEQAKLAIENVRLMDKRLALVETKLPKAFGGRPRKESRRTNDQQPTGQE